jgi:hypothetical protein
VKHQEATLQERIYGRDNMFRRAALIREEITLNGKTFRLYRPNMNWYKTEKGQNKIKTIKCKILYMQKVCQQLRIVYHTRCQITLNVRTRTLSEYIYIYIYIVYNMYILYFFKE